MIITQLNMVLWCSWLSRGIHIAEVSSSILDGIIFALSGNMVLEKFIDENSTFVSKALATSLANFNLT